MIKRLLFLPAMVIGFSMHAKAATCPISSGASSSTIVSTIQGCASGNTATFAVGSYSLSTTVNVPCGVSITGPVVPLAVYTGGDGLPREGYAPTAIISNTATPAFSYGSCSTARSLEYLEVNSNRPANFGGQVVYATTAGGISNLTISYNYFHGNYWNGSSGAPYGSGAQNAVLVLFDGSTGTTADVNDTVSWNRFGANGDCAGVMNNNSYAGFTGDGGYCTSVGFHTNMTNFSVMNNLMYYQEQGLKGYEGNWACLNCLVEYNDFSNIHRIDFEEQVGGGTPGTVITTAYNSIHDPVSPGNGSFGLSTASGCTNNHPSGNQCTIIDTGNVVIENVATCCGSSFNGLGIEYWSANSASTGNYNLIQGEWSNSFMVATDGSMTASNNHIQSSFGWGGSNTPANCNPYTPGSYGWWNQEDSPANTPAGTGNQCDFFDGSRQTSVTPSISPASGSFSGSQVVTFNCSGCTNRDSNTGIWYTTDGSTPTPASGTAKYISIGGTITVTSTTTVKAVGMWGAANQPASYPTGPLGGGCSGSCPFGYGPSSAVSATYTSGPSCPYNITSYGAVGNGSTDNTTAINNAFSAAHTAGCAVLVPAGTFNYSNNLNANGLTISGVGSGSILAATSATNTAIIATGSGFSLSNLVMTSNATTRQSTPQSAMVYLNGASNFTVNNVRFVGSPSVGVFSLNASNNGTVKNNTFVGTLADTISQIEGANHITVDHNLIINAGDDGISNNAYSSDGNTVNNINITNNTVLHNLSGRGLEASGGTSYIFSGNYVDNTDGYANMYVSSETSSYQTQAITGITITGNSFQHSGPNQGSMLFWAESSGNSITGISATSNQFNAPIDEAVELAGTGTPMSGNVSGNTSYQSSGSFNTTSGNSTITFSSNTVLPTGSYPGTTVTPVGGTVPIFSLPTGTYTLPQTLTLNEPGTSVAMKYCTVTGSSPCTPTTAYSSSITISTPEIVCALGVDSSSLTPVTSASICATYNGGGSSTPAATPVLAPSSSSFYPTQSVTITDSTTGSTIYYTLDGSTPTTSSNVYSSALTLNATTTVKAIAAASGFTNSAVASGTYTYTVPTLTGATSTNTGSVTSVAVGGTVQQIGKCSYSAGPIYTCSPGLDANGSKISTWGSSNSAVFTVSAAGLVTGIGTGTASVTCSAQQGSNTPVTCTPYSITVVNSPPTLLGVTIALQIPPGGSTVTIGTPVQACGTLTYTGSITTTQCNNSADAYGTTLSAWNSSSPSNGTISTSGLVTGVANGTTNIKVTATNGSANFTATPVTITINTAVTGANSTASGSVMYSGSVVAQ